MSKIDHLPVTRQSFFTIQKADPSGRALALYLFYVQLAIKQDSSQPLASDHFCMKGLKWGSLNTVSKARKRLETAGVIEHIKKQSFYYVKVNYLNIEFSNQRFHLSVEPIPPGVMGTTAVFEYYSKWWDRLINSSFDEFVKRLKKKMGLNEKPDFDKVYDYANIVYDRINSLGYGITNVDTELRFWYYLLSGVETEISNERRTQMKAA